MGGIISRFYRRNQEGAVISVAPAEHCIYVESDRALTSREVQIMTWILGETFDPQGLARQSFLAESQEKHVVEIGPRLNFATAWNTNALAILRSCGITSVTRVERSRRYQGEGPWALDRMTEMPYASPLQSFETGIIPSAVFTIPLMEKGPEALKTIPGVAMDEVDRQMYYDYFVGKCHRNPTNVEILDLNNANSEHSRHGYFRGRQVVDGVLMPETLMEIVKSTLKRSSNSRSAFCDNASAILGYWVETIVPQIPGKCSPFRKGLFRYHILFTAETHNFPSGIEPFEGSGTGAGGRLRDGQATGRGGLVIAGTAGYCVGNLRIPGYQLPWEDETFVYPGNLASPLQIMIGASNGASDYGNKFGEPMIQGFARSFGMRLPNGERREWLKPIMFTGGLGQIAAKHLKKEEAEKGMLIIQIGGPAYRIGFGGGAASSMLQGENEAELDFNAVQRGDAETEQRMNRVVRACVELDDRNPIVTIHDQGAGGPANVLKELVEKAGGRIELRRIQVGDPTMSAVEIWVAEFQERNGLLIRKRHLRKFQAICKREKVVCEVLGEVTGDGIFMVHDAQDNSTPVNLHLADVLGNVPQKEFRDERIPANLNPLKLPKGITMRDALERVLRNVAVGSKRFLTNKVDRSVTGLIAQQQCVGPLQLPLSNVAVVAQSHFGLTGAATAIGERPLFGLVDSGAQGRMTVAEMLTNIVWAKLSGLSDIKCSGNWMWAPKLPGEGAKIYDTAVAMRDLMTKLGIAIDGGKDSLSMATKVKESGELVKSPGQLVLSGYCTVPDITKVVTPDLKKAGSLLIFIDLAKGKRRLGGSVLAQCYGQVGNECPDVEDPKLLKRAFNAIQRLVSEDLILSGHDVSDGGLIVTLLEMAFAGNRGISVRCDEDNPLGWFSEEAGLVIECRPENVKLVKRCFRDRKVPFQIIGAVHSGKWVGVFRRNNALLLEEISELRNIWEETSYQLERLQCDPKCADEERRNIRKRSGQRYNLPFVPEVTAKKILNRSRKLKVAIVREEGSNGDREMTAAFFQAGFEPWDVTMTDLIGGKISLDRFRGVVFVGGFSYADVMDSAKGWAAGIRFNRKVKAEFDRFYKRPDTFSLGVCNGCQLMALLGWVPKKGIAIQHQPRFIHNASGRFESRWSTVKILKSPAIMLSGMEESVLGVWVAHGEGRIHFPDQKIREMVEKKGLAPLRFVNDRNVRTEEYPFNPNGSVVGITALCDLSGRHLAMMPHPERAFLLWQWAWLPEEWKHDLKASPWLRMFQNAREWCEENR